MAAPEDHQVPDGGAHEPQHPHALRLDHGRHHEDCQDPQPARGRQRQRERQGIDEDHQQPEDRADQHDDSGVGGHRGALGQDRFAGPPEELPQVVHGLRGRDEPGNAVLPEENEGHGHDQRRQAAGSHEPGPGTQGPEHRHGERNGEDGAEHRGVPGPPAQNAVESEGRARDGHRDGGRHHPGLGAGSVRPGRRAGGQDCRFFRAGRAGAGADPWLRCGASVMAGPPRRGGRRPRRTSPGLPGRRLPRRQAASSGRIPPRPAIRPAAAPPAPRALRRNPVHGP